MATRGSPKGHKKAGGRPKGVPNKITASIKALAGKHGPDAIAKLVKIMKDKKAPHATQIAACRELLDRGYGKPAQEVTGEGGGPIKITFDAEDKNRR